MIWVPLDILNCFSRPQVFIFFDPARLCGSILSGCPYVFNRILWAATPFLGPLRRLSGGCKPAASSPCCLQRTGSPTPSPVSQLNLTACRACDNCEAGCLNPMSYGFIMFHSWTQIQQMHQCNSMRFKKTSEFWKWRTRGLERCVEMQQVSTRISSLKLLPCGATNSWVTTT